MATEYKTIRVTPEVHKLAEQLAEKMRMRSVSNLPGMAHDATVVPLGKVAEIGMRLLEQELEKPLRKKADDE